jgi:hypothetical protein
MPDAQETADGSYFSSTAYHQLEVIPVLEVSANHRPSAARTGHHVVSMEVHHPFAFSPNP